MAVTSKLASKLGTRVPGQGKLAPDGTLEQATTAIGAGATPAPVTPDDTLAGTAGQAGLPQTPVLPGTADSLGASPDASKMAGTPAAMAASVTRAAPPPTAGSSATTSVPAATPEEQYTSPASNPKTLAEADKGAAANAERVQSEDQAKRQARSQELQVAYGDVGLSVANLINQAIPQAVTPGAVYKTVELPGNLQSAKAALDAHYANPTDPALFKAAQEAVKAAGQAPGDLSQFRTDVSGGQAVANRTPDTIALTPDVLSQLGISPQDAALLGLPEDMSKLTVADISAAIKKAQLDASPLADVNAVANAEGGSVGRAAARDIKAAQGGEELSTEIETNQILDQVNEGDTLEINGQSYKIEDLLNDEKITDLVDQYLASPEGSPIRKKLDSQMPSLAKFAKDNEASLKAGRSAAEASTGKIIQNQQGNQKIVDSLSTSLGMDANAVRSEIGALVPELADEFGTDAGSLDKVGLFAALANPQEYGIASGAAALAKAKQLKALDPEAFNAFARMSPAEVKATGVFSPDQDEAAAGWADFIEAVQEQETLKAMPSEDLQKYFFGGSDLKSVWANARAKQGTVGDRADYDRLQPLLDANKDGQLDDEATVNERLKSKVQQEAPTELVKKLGLGQRLTSGKKAVGGKGTDATGLAKTVSGFLANDGQIDAKEASSLDPNTPADELEEIWRTISKTDVPARTALSTKIQKSRDLGTDRTFDGLGFEGDLKDAVYSAMYSGPSSAATQPAPKNGELWVKYGQAIDSINKVLNDPKQRARVNATTLNNALKWLTDSRNGVVRGASGQGTAPGLYQPGQVAIDSLGQTVYNVNDGKGPKVTTVGPQPGFQQPGQVGLTF